jgi:NAD+ diphosphatase
VKPTTFSGASLDRAAARRTDAGWLAARLADPETRAVAVTRGGVLLDPGDATRLARVPLAEHAAGGGLAPVFLGVEDGRALFAVDADGAEGAEGAVGLRDAAAGLAQAEGGLAAYASALLNWHRVHGHCANCGAPTDVVEAGFARRCPRCGATHHPRTDPVVIMLVVDEAADRIVMGRQPSWPPGRWSALAGFVEPGESLEEAVAREVREEAGVAIGAPRYVASQPWPFPASLMLGFMAPWAGGEPATADEELEDVRWFDRAEVEAAVAGRGDVRVPPRLAIARRLIEVWLDPGAERAERG